MSKSQTHGAKVMGLGLYMGIGGCALGITVVKERLVV